MKLSQTEKEQLKLFKEDINLTIKANSRSGFINYYAIRRFERDFMSSLTSFYTNSFASNQMNLLFEGLCFVVKKIGKPLNMDDSDGTTSNIMYEVMDFYRQCILMMPPKETAEALKWFEKNFSNEKIIDYIQEYILNIYICMFNDEKSLKSKLTFFDKYLKEKFDLNGVQCFDNFEYEKIAIAKINTMKLLGFSEIEVVSFMEKFSSIHKVCLLLADSYIAKKEYEKAEQSLYKLIEENKRYPGIIHNAQKKLYDVYKAADNTEKLKDILQTLLLKEYTFNTNLYYEYKSYFPNDEWHSKIKEIFSISRKFEFDIYCEEKMYDCLFESLKRKHLKNVGNYFIKKYFSVLMPKYSNQLVEMFVENLEKEIKPLNNREKYKSFAKNLVFLVNDLQALEKATELREKWFVEYKNKPALIEELNRAF